MGDLPTSSSSTLPTNPSHPTSSIPPSNVNTSGTITVGDQELNTTQLGEMINSINLANLRLVEENQALQQNVRLMMEDRAHGETGKERGLMDTDEEDDDKPIRQIATDLLSLLRKGDNAAPEVFVPPISSITRRPAHDHGVTTGLRDMKDAKMPAPFAGYPEDARPFIIRMEGYFLLKPNAYRLSFVRQMTACSLITEQPAATWATTVHHQWISGIRSVFYYETWAEFGNAFMEHFGVPNEKQDAVNKLDTMRQTGTLTTYIAEFLKYRELSGLTDNDLLYKFKRGIRRGLFYDVGRLDNPPVTLEDWMNRCKARDEQLNELASFQTVQRPQDSNRKQRPVSSPFQGYAQYHRQATVDPNAMQVDAMRQKQPHASKTRQGSSGKGKTKPRTKRTNPTPSSSSSRSFPSPRIPISEITCYKCGKKGHMMAHCNINAADLSHQELLNIAHHTMEERSRHPQPVEQEAESSDDEELASLLREKDDEDSSSDEEQDFPKTQ